MKNITTEIQKRALQMALSDVKHRAKKLFTPEEFAQLTFKTTDGRIEVVGTNSLRARLQEVI